MKLNRLNDDKLQILISKDDLQERDLKKWDIVPYNPVAQKMFQEILEEAYQECGFEVEQDTQLMIEAYPMTGESMLLTVTKVGSLGKGLFDLDFLEHQDDNYIDEFMSDDDVKLEMDEIVYAFDDLEDVIAVAKRVVEQYEAVSSLYKCGRKYYLVADSAAVLGADMAILSEYGEVEEISAAYLDEHGQLVIEKEAIERLASL